MQHLEGSGTPVLYIGRTVLKGQCVDKHMAGGVYFLTSSRDFNVHGFVRRNNILVYNSK